LKEKRHRLVANEPKPKIHFQVRIAARVRGTLVYCMGSCEPLAIWRGRGKEVQMADEDVQAELARLRAENESLKQKRNSAVSMKVSEKGAVSVYGLGRFPVTLYMEQWQKLLALADEIKSFIEENRAKLKVKE